MNTEATCLKEDNGKDTLKRMRKWLYIMNIWFLFEHIFVAIGMYGREVSDGEIVALIIWNLIVNYYGFYAWYYIKIDLENMGNKTNNDKTEASNQCPFYSLVILEIVMLINCAFFGIRGLVRNTTADDINKRLGGEFYAAMTIIGTLLTVLLHADVLGR